MSTVPCGCSVLERHPTTMVVPACVERCPETNGTSTRSDRYVCQACRQHWEYDRRLHRWFPKLPLRNP